MKFEIVDEKERYNARIKVIGVGGAGGNAINNMISTRLRGVEFIVANTDCQDLDRSACSYKIQLGPSITRGLGAGSDPEIGKQSAEESINEIRETVEGTDMVFIAAGMGGGTGTGAAPVVARECKEGGALTVAVVTKPFSFEGDKRMERAVEGIDKLKDEVDSLIILPNERLKSLGDQGSSFKELISRADDVLLQAVKGISDLIISNGFFNLDFADVKKVMGQMGTAIMGMGRAKGEGKAIEAAQMAINSPLLEDISISGAKGLLINITGSPEITMDEINEAANYIKGEVSQGAEIFFGVVFDESMEDEVQVTVIATGIEGDIGYRPRSRDIIGEPHSNVVKLRDVEPEDVRDEWSVKMNGEILDMPSFKGRESEPFAARRAHRTKGKRGFLRKLGIGDSLDYPTFLRKQAD